MLTHNCQILGSGVHLARNRLTWSKVHRSYRLTAPAEIGPNDAPRYKIESTDEGPFFKVGDDGNHEQRKVDGGWFRSWAKEMPKAAMFNGRIEGSTRRRPFGTPSSRSAA